VQIGLRVGLVRPAARRGLRMAAGNDRSLIWPGGLWVAAVLTPLAAGCAVPQGAGNGTLLRVAEPTTGRPYWLYLPQQYPAEKSHMGTGRQWPLVVTLHGMKPFDSYRAQIDEWQQQADAYGFIVCSPDLDTSALFMELPLRKVHSYVRRDERTILAMMDHVFRTTDANPQQVLITSWSSGGYLAHYMLNRHPYRFTCLAVRQSNFSERILDPRYVHLYASTPVAIFFGQNDFAICREESTRAVTWYRDRGFSVTAYCVEALGHERTPQTAANYFARACQLQVADKAMAQRALARIRAQPVAVAQ